jgi:purine-binding chemotaxis protein CheW
MPEHGQRHRPDPQKSLVEFIVGDVHYAIDIVYVREIVNPLPVTPLPYTPREVVGVSDHRGKVVPIVDLRARFGLPSAETSRSTKWILVNAPREDDHDGLVGLVVDAVTEVFGTAGEEMRQTPELGGNKDARGISGVVTHNGTLTFVLDKTRIVEVVSSLVLPGIA